MPQYVTTPWFSPADLLAVRSALYPPSTAPQTVREKRQRDADMRHAIARIEVWVRRGGCPHLVEATGWLRAAEVGDAEERRRRRTRRKNRGEGGGNEERTWDFDEAREGGGRWCVRAAYGAAFSRFVTGLLDSHQTTRSKQSMYSIAKTLHLPATYVELRHQATHEALPSLTKLRAATQKALLWIWNYYWVHLDDDGVSLVEAGRSVGDLVMSWIREQDEAKKEAFEVASRRSRRSSKQRDELVTALMHAAEVVDAEGDVHTRLRIARFLNEAMGADKSVELESSPVTKSIDVIRAEISKTEEELNAVMKRDKNDVKGGQGVDDDVLMAEADVEEYSSADGESGSGWTMWKGPWVPKPIGVV